MSPLAPQAVAREVRDMRDRRNVDRLNSHLVSPVSLSPVVLAMGIIGLLAGRQLFPQFASIFGARAVRFGAIQTGQVG